MIGWLIDTLFFVGALYGAYWFGVWHGRHGETLTLGEIRAFVVSTWKWLRAVARAIREAMGGW